MTVYLDHHIVPTHDKIQSAEFYARIFGVPFDAKDARRFARVDLSETMSFDFDNVDEEIPYRHYAFLVSEPEFDQILERVKAEGLKFGSDHLPETREDMNVGTSRGGRGFYFSDPNGYSLEVITKTYQGRGETIAAS
jgi:catechol 2,3-dioxygenase-like lactoylglutathione lyase family enzyme